ncbi:hypothetical protein ABTL40_19810, partial [Acinetobacter baumannii]
RQGRLGHRSEDVGRTGRTPGPSQSHLLPQGRVQPRQVRKAQVELPGCRLLQRNRGRGQHEAG